MSWVQSYQPPPIVKKLLHDIVTYWLDQLRSSLGHLKPADALDFLIAQDEAILANEAFRRKQLPRRLACFGARPEELERLRRRLGNAVESAVASRFLIELLTAFPGEGTAVLTTDEYEKLLAQAYDLIEKGMLSDAYHYELAEVRITMLDSGRLGIDRSEPYQSALKSFGDARADTVWAAAQYSQTPAVRDPESGLSIDDADLSSAFNAEFGVTLREIISGIAALIFDQSELKDVYRIPRTVAVETLIQAEWTQAKVEAFLELLTLGPRSEFMVNGSLGDVAPFRYNRALSYVRRPLLVQGDEIVFGMRRLTDAPSYLLGLVESGRLKASTREMRRLVSQVRGRITEGFNNHLAFKMSEIQGLLVKSRVKKFGRLQLRRPNGEDLGDIDVLVVDQSRKKIWLLEAKDFEVARTPLEFSREVRKLNDGPKATTALHADRGQWVRQNVPAVLRSLDFDASGGWAVISVIVVSEDLVALRLVKADIPILTVEQTVSAVRRGRVR